VYHVQFIEFVRLLFKIKTNITNVKLNAFHSIERLVHMRHRQELATRLLNLTLIENRNLDWNHNIGAGKATVLFRVAALVRSSCFCFYNGFVHVCVYIIITWTAAPMEIY
jgi:hypothetical protein